ncbi:MAG: NAD(P)-dependent oxidoreductase [Silicimonas sp.]|nr:NAD(P)-dependent oxidoreductase [Silicimonas sp.]
MNTQTIAMLMPGDMGHAVGGALREHGHDVITCLDGRSDHTCALATKGGLRDVGTLNAAVGEADLILSILPPAAALQLAKQVAKAMASTGKTPAYVDCNAIAPETVIAVGDVITKAGATFIDAGIIGLAPGKGTPPRFYASGPQHELLLALDGHGIQVIGLGPVIGQASAIKMTYAALTKGTWTLQTAVLLAAEQLGVTTALLSEFENSQAAALKSMRASIPFLPADSARWVGEMEEIAKTFADAGVTPLFHEGAADIFRVLEQTPLAAETRADMDKSRTLEEALAIYKEFLSKPS